MTVTPLPIPRKLSRPAKTPCFVPAYAELAVSTNFSFLRGASHPLELVARAKYLGLSAIGIADRNSVAGVVRAYTAGKKCGMKVAIGARLVFADETPDILAYPASREGWGRLTRLLSAGKLKASKGDCILGFDDLLQDAGDINFIVMPSRQIHTKALRHVMERLNAASSKQSVWLAAAMAYRGDDMRRLSILRGLAAEARTPLIAVNDVLYHLARRRMLQDILTCIREGTTIEKAGKRLEANAERHLKSPLEMARLFRMAPELVAQTQQFMDRCRFDLGDLSRTEYPKELRQGYETPQQALEAFCETGIQNRYPQGAPEAVRKSLASELDFIGRKNFAPFFLTVYEIVRHARALTPPILCQGRGSAANSTVCFCLGITEVDPEESGLFFARFLSDSRDEPPDIDVDFEHERREEVIQHVYDKYGRDHAGIAATVISYRGRSAIRDVGKVFGLSEDTTALLSNSHWGWSMEHITAQVTQKLGLDPSDRKIRFARYFARKLLGFPRHLSQHVGGFVITNSRLDEVVPIENAAMEKRTFIEWDKDDLNDLGLLKVDVLALGMLSCLRRCFDLLRTHYGTHRDLSKRDEKPEVYRMIQRADTLGTFQIESRAQMSMLPRLKPNKFYDLVIEVAIVRPGPIQGKMVHPYLKRREGKEAVSFPSEALRAILIRTLGIPLFQEQAMRIAVDAAGFTESEADALRRSMASWRRNGDIEVYEKRFVDGMVDNGYERDFAVNCFSQIQGFGEYGFPESHAASFANLVYASCWMKCRYPDVFAAALLNSQPMGFYAPSQIVRDVQEHGVEVREIDINASCWDCTLEPGRRSADHLHPRHATMADAVQSTHALRLGFRQINGFPEADARRIESVRGDGFDSIRDLWLRTGLAPSVLERLAAADAFRSLGLDRRAASWIIRALRRSGDKDDLPLFARVAMPSIEPDANLPAMPPGQQVVEDYRYLHLSLKAHPVSFLRHDLEALRALKHEALPGIGHSRRVTVAGLVLVRQRPGTAKGVIFATLEDETGIANVVIWQSTFEKFRPIVLGARLIAITGKLQNVSDVIHVVADEIVDLTHLLGKLSAEGPRIDITAPVDEVKRPVLSRQRHPRSGDVLVTLWKDGENYAAELGLGADANAVMPKGRNFH